MFVRQRIKTLLLFFGLLTITASLSSCTRAGSNDKAKISVAVPQFVKSQKMGALAFDSLMHVSINITGGGISSPIIFNWDRQNNGPAAATTTETVPTAFTLEVTKGTDRLIQILAVYGNSESSGGGAMQFYYGDVTKSLSEAVEEVPIVVNSVGQGTTIISGRIQGRYLTSDNDGPTSRVDVVYVPPGGKSPMIVERSMIMSGWFQFFGLLGAQLGYRLQDGSYLWGGPVELSESFFPASNKVMRATLPIHLRSENYSGGTTTTRQEDPNINIYGFFGDAAAVASRSVCKDTASSTLTRLLKIGTSTALTVNDNNSADPSNLFDTNLGYINIRGGVSFGSAAPCDSAANLEANIFKSALGFKPSMLENGNDNSAGFRLPFQLPTSANNNGGGSVLSSTIVDANNISVSGTLLPGIPNMVDNFAVFKAINLGMNFHFHSSYAPCEALMGMGFTLVGNTPVSGSAYTATLPLNDTEASGGAMFAFCPTKGGAPVGPGAWVQASYMRFTGGGGGCMNCGGGGVGGGGGTPERIGIQGLLAITNGQCSYVNIGLYTNTMSPASATAAVSVNLSVTGSGSFYDANDYGCTGTTIAVTSIPAGSNWIGLNFKSTATPETNITLTASDASAVLAADPKTVRVRGVGSVSQVMFNVSNQSANVGTCLPMSVRATETNGNIVSYNGAVSVTVNGGTIYTDPGCTANGGALSFAAGIANFYLKGTVAGWANLQATATIDGLDFQANYGIGIFPAGQPTHLAFSSPSPSYLYINQCMPIVVTAKDDAFAPSPVPSDQVINFSSAGAGPGNYFYTDANCSTQMNNAQATILAGQSSLPIYFKPQNFGNIGLNAYINGNNYYLNGYVNYSIGNLWMHVIAAGFNGSWYDANCATVTFQLMDNVSAGAGAVIPNFSGSSISIGMNTNNSTVDGGLYTTPSCTDAVSSSIGTSIAAGSSSTILYMKSLLASGNYVSVFPSYFGTYSPIYQNGNTLSSLGFAWCPPLDGGGACASSLSPSGPGVGGGVASYGPNSIGIPVDKSITITNTTGVLVSLSAFTITGGQAADYTFKGGSYPGTGGTCTGAISGFGNCTVVVTFNPGAIGGRYANLNINYNGTTLPLALQGDGL